MKTVDEIIDENSNIYRWDNGTLDLCFYDKSFSFLSQVKETNCFRCDTPLELNNELRVAEISEFIKGIQLECSECALKYFLHQQVTFDKD